MASKYSGLPLEWVGRTMVQVVGVFGVGDRQCSSEIAGGKREGRGRRWRSISAKAGCKICNRM